MSITTKTATFEYLFSISDTFEILTDIMCDCYLRWTEVNNHSDSKLSISNMFVDQRSRTCVLAYTVDPVDKEKRIREGIKKSIDKLRLYIEKFKITKHKDKEVFNSLSFTSVPDNGYTDAETYYTFGYYAFFKRLNMFHGVPYTKENILKVLNIGTYIDKVSNHGTLARRVLSTSIQIPILKNQKVKKSIVIPVKIKFYIYPIDPYYLNTEMLNIIRLLPETSCYRITIIDSEDDHPFTIKDESIIKIVAQKNGICPPLDPWLKHFDVITPYLREWKEPLAIYFDNL